MNSNVKNRKLVRGFCSSCASHFTYEKWSEWDGLCYVNKHNMNKACEKCGHNNHVHIKLEDLPFSIFPRATFREVIETYVKYKKKWLFEEMDNKLKFLKEKYEENKDIENEIQEELKFNKSKLKRIEELGSDFGDEIDNIKRLINNLTNDILVTVSKNLEISKKALNDYTISYKLTKEYYEKA